MPPRSKVAGLPGDIREALEQRLIDSGFSGYQEHEDWLAERGYRISRMAVHRHGVALEREIELVRIASEECRAIEMAVEDDGESLAFGILTQCQVKLHQLLRAAEDGDAKVVGSLARALGDILRAGISIRRERKLGRQEGLAEASKIVGSTAGVSDDAVAAIRAAFERAGQE